MKREGGDASMMTRRQKHIMNDENCPLNSPIELVRVAGTKKKNPVMIAAPDTWRGEGDGDCFSDSRDGLESQLTRDHENVDPEMVSSGVEPPWAGPELP